MLIMTGNERSKYLNTGFVLWATFIFLLHSMAVCCFPSENRRLKPLYFNQNKCRSNDPALHVKFNSKMIYGSFLSRSKMDQ
jgi:hypothetical protein